MSRAGFQKSVRMFHKFSEETMRRRGGDPAGRESIAALAALEAVLKGERPFTAELREPLAAFTNLLQSSQLPPEFGDYSLGDALLAIEEAQADRRQGEPQHWEFEPDVGDEAAAALVGFWQPPAAPAPSMHADALRRFVLEAADAVDPRSVLVVGALREPAVPIAELCQRFERVTLNDLDLPALEERVRRVVPEPLRAKVSVERYDPTGSYAAFASGVKSALEAAETQADAERALVELLESYDVGARSAGLSSREEQPDLAISAQVLPELGRGPPRALDAAFSGRGFDAARLDAPLSSALALFGCLLEQHHVQALLRRAKSAVLISAVSEVTLRQLPNGKDVAASEPRDLLSVERLVERLPTSADVKAEQSWEWRRGDVLALIEALRV